MRMLCLDCGHLQGDTDVQRCLKCLSKALMIEPSIDNPDAGTVKGETFQDVQAREQQARRAANN